MNTAKSATLVIAPPLKRAMAAAIDTSMVGTIALAVLLAVTRGATTALFPAQAVGSVLLASMTYHLFFLSTMSATPGKALIGLYVCDLRGRPISADTASVRFLVYLTGHLVLLGPLVSAFLIVTDPMRRGLHDRIAGTLVVEGRAEG